jgi:hypothetical protein
MNTLRYYIDLASALCGFDGTDNYTVFGWFVIALAAAIVVYVFYVGVTKTIWPGEDDPNHIKYRILDDSDEEAPHAH